MKTYKFLVVHLAVFKLEKPDCCWDVILSYIGTGGGGGGGGGQKQFFQKGGGSNHLGSVARKIRIYPVLFYIFFVAL